jgi:hypothetical protein
MTTPEKTLARFIEIAAQCNEDECIEIMADCKSTLSPFISGPVHDVYAKRYESLKKAQVEIEYYESKFDNE